MGDDIALGFVTYKPIASLIDRLQMICEVGYQVYLFDNSPADGAIREFAKQRSDVHYFTCGKNIGLGIGISMLCAQAYYDSYSGLLFFDQDTVFNRQTLNFVEDFYRNQLAVRDVYSAIVFNAKDLTNQGPPPNCEIKDTLLARSSGSLFILQNLHAFNWHDEQYFVDGVDYAFCLKSKRAGFKIGECTVTPGFDHQSEQPDREYEILGKRLMLRKYPAARIREAIWSSLKLIGCSIRTLEYKFCKEITRSLLIYAAAQILVRLLNAFDRPPRLRA
jgi:rhamnosyltransferase